MSRSCFALLFRQGQGATEKGGGKEAICVIQRRLQSDISTQTVSRWIVQAVRLAFKTIADDSHVLRVNAVKAHDVWALSASLSHLRGVSLEQILRAACWKCHNTFTSFYLKDLSLESQGLLALGPIVASQTVLQR